MIVIALLLGAIPLLYVWLKWNYTYWKRNKVPGPDPTLIIGNIGPTLNFSEHWGVLTANWYKQYPNEPYVGYYKLTQPAILARDPDLIKDILISKFNSFRDNEFKLSKKQDPLIIHTPFFSKGDEWTKNRRTILPAFSQAKVKSMFAIMNRIGEALVEFIKSHPPNTDFHGKNLSFRLITENVIKCAFSIDPDCFNRKEESEFFSIIKELFTPSFLVGLKVLMMPVFPEWLMNYFPVSFIPNKVDCLFRDLVKTNKASRPENFQGSDVLQTYIQAQRKNNFDDIALAGYALALFIDGIDTTSAGITHALFDLAQNPHCQQEVFEEITENLAKYDGQLTFDGIQEMSYLECVLLESLRLHPPLMVMSKMCTQSYTLPKTSEQSEPVTIHPGTAVNIPVLAIHMDPKYYPDPEQFIPERFTQEEIRNRHKALYLSFGEGPRICSGMRFANIQFKLALIHLVKNFRIKLSPNHKRIVIDPQTLLMYPKDGVLVQFEAR